MDGVERKRESRARGGGCGGVGVVAAKRSDEV